MRHDALGAELIERQRECGLTHPHTDALPLEASAQPGARLQRARRQVVDLAIEALHSEDVTAPPDQRRQSVVFRLLRGARRDEELSRRGGVFHLHGWRSLVMDEVLRGRAPRGRPDRG